MLAGAYVAQHWQRTQALVCVAYIAGMLQAISRHSGGFATRCYPFNCMPYSQLERDGRTLRRSE
jgi:hypothetical protein